METLLSLLKPIFVPLLKLDESPPHLPEGSTLVRELGPSENWLSYRYLAALFGLLNQFIGTGIAAVALTTKMGKAGWALALLLFAIQAISVGFALVVVRVDYELRHYLVGDRSLRVVHGAWTREEATLSYANVQNIEVTQGPLERVFGFKSLMISTAGSDSNPGQDNSHVIQLVGLEDAEKVKQLIMGMLKNQKDSGLGEVDERAHQVLSTKHLEDILAASKRLQTAARLQVSSRSTSV
jgi:membrane protein YdbS with pleckstrin-like domain